MKTSFICMCLGAILPGIGQVFANGGPIDTSGSLGQGNMRMIHENNIVLRSEKLTVAPVGDWVDVHAVYTLENTGEAREVEYGFPVDVYRYDFMDYYDSSGKEPIVFILDGAMPLQYGIVSFEGNSDSQGNDDCFDKVRIDWFTTQLSFQPGEIKTISVHSRILAGYEDFATSKDFLPGFSYRSFRYVLSPAGYWGCGTAEEFQGVVDFTWVRSHGGSVENVTGPGDWIDENLYGLAAEGFNLAGAEPLKIKYSVYDWKIANLIEEYSLPAWQMSNYSASSELPSQADFTYECRNLFDGDVATAWAEGSTNTGEGEWIEVELPEGYGLGLIAIVNGYQRNRETYESNGKASEILCTVSFADGTTDSFVCCLDDQYWEEIGNDPTHGYQVLYNSGLAEEAVRFKLEVLEAYSGDTCDDMCISECIVMGNPGGVWFW